MNCLTTTQLFWLLEADDHAPGVDAKISHMVDCSRCKARLDQLATQYAPPMAELLGGTDISPPYTRQSLPSSEHWLEGLSHLRLVRLIGQGGMGEVYECHDVELDRTVAVKTLRADRLRPELLARHRREALLQASLNHPNIVSVYDFDISPAGLPYFVMEYVQGRTLADLVRDRSLTASTSVEIMLQVASAVAFSHQHQVLHRDLKPSNILLKPTTLDTTQPSVARLMWQPKITDFGLARLLQPGLDITPSQSTLGTPAYLSPESINKDLGEVSTGTDIYALGVMLYECFTGRPPFLAESVAETLRMIQELAPVAPSQLNPSLPLDLETICLKCLEKEPARRYPSAQALADDLDRFRRGLPILARPISRLGKALRWHHRNRSLSAAVATVGLLLVALGLGGIWFAVEQSRLRAVADQRADEARTAQAKAVLYSDLARNNLMQSLNQLHSLEKEMSRLAQQNPGSPGIELARQTLESKKKEIALGYINQSLRLGVQQGMELERVFRDALAMNDIGLRPSAIPVLEKLLEITMQPGAATPSDPIAPIVGHKASTILAVWQAEDGHQEQSAQIFRKSRAHWSINPADKDLSAELAFNRVTLDTMLLHLLGSKPEHAAERDTLNAEIKALMPRSSQWQPARR